MKTLKAILSLLLAIGFTFLLNNKWSDIPPFGKLLSPFVGFWQNAETSTGVFSDKSLKFGELKGEVSVVFDDNAVPHVFAENDYDLYFMQGYVIARDRLWQMEFMTHAAAGRLSEIVGDKMLETDRYMRHTGTVYAAEKMLEAMLSDPISKQVTEAYTAGINAYIAQLVPKNYPLEYKLLGYAPEQWTPLKCALLQKAMAHTLNSIAGGRDLAMTNVLKKYGVDVVKDLFPDYPTTESPIIPAGTAWDFQPVKIPEVPAIVSEKIASKIALDRKKPWEESEGIGSNNWAIHGSKSVSGLPILSNDPHLELNLPSIWYQMQLVSPTVNVYGVTLPGSPGIVIGFNQNVAWGVTNVASDVADWYEVQFKDSSMKEYLYGGSWKPTTTRLETIKIRGEKTVTDTVYYTHQGPIVYKNSEKPLRVAYPKSHALRWAAHESSNDIRAFYQLNRANNYNDYTQALSYYASPAQNFCFASNQNDIAMWVNGRFPLKWSGQGKFLLDASNPAHDWQGWIPQTHNPHVKNPARGFVSSANQFSTDPSYPYYLNWQYAPSERGIRINETLTTMQQVQPADLQHLQNDNFSVMARTVLPELLKNVAINQLGTMAKMAFDTLTGWDKYNAPNYIAPTIFETWITNMNDAIWKDEFGSQEPLLRYPSRDRTYRLILQEPKAKWFDDITTKNQETLPQLATATLNATIDTLLKKHGADFSGWQWYKHKGTKIMHLAKLAPFSRLDIRNGGGASIVNATTERNGPSWRMVVALGKEPKAMALYPGGQSGNPGSYYYDNMVDKWANGELIPLLYMHTANQKTNGRSKAYWKVSGR